MNTKRIQKFLFKLKDSFLEESEENRRMLDTYAKYIEGTATEKEIDELILKRQIAKENKDYTNADQIREQLLKLDIILEDKPDKTIWRKS